MQQKIMILTTSNIQEVFAADSISRYRGQTIKHEALPRAVWEGFKVLVFSTRHKLFETDAWWVEIVGRENVFLAEPGDYSAGWKKGLASLGIPYPHNEYGDPLDWFWARDLLRQENPRRVFFREDLDSQEIDQAVNNDLNNDLGV